MVDTAMYQAQVNLKAGRAEYFEALLIINEINLKG